MSRMIEFFRLASRRCATLTALAAVSALSIASCTFAPGAEQSRGSENNAANHSTTSPETPDSTAVSENDPMMASTLGSDLTAASTQAGVTPRGNADTAMKTQRPEAPSQLLVTNVRVASHAGFDRVVFDLVGEGTPGWFINYTSSPAQQGSGKSVTFTGEVALDVNIDGTAYPFELDLPSPNIGTVAGAGNVTEVISQGTFEGSSQFIIGLTSTLPSSVKVLQDPHRLVIDIPQV